MLEDTELRCQCGCDGVIPAERKHKYFTPRFIRGHQFRASVRTFPPPNRYTPTPEEIPSGLCECGCGRLTTIAKVTYRDRRHFKGHPVPFVVGHNVQPKGSENANWRGGRSRTMYGYVMAYAPDHPAADKNGYVREHRLVVEAELGRYLLPTEHVHHKNGIKDDNRPENLVALTRAEHASEHVGDKRYYSPEARARMSVAGKKGAAARWGKRPTAD